MRVNVDTNILISAILFPNGKAADVFSYIIKTHDLAISSYSIEECETVFARKFPMKMACLRNFFDGLSFELFQTPKTIDSGKYPNIRDLNGLPILVSAILSDADILITGDKDFDDIEINKPLIFTPNQYYELIKNKDN
jgi:putative PIN family toxin of toxin-antitoxin system